MSRLGDAGKSEGHNFSAFGFSRLGPFPATRARGTILGPVTPPEDRRLQIDPVELESQQIDRGMSGAPVLDTDRNLVVGVVAETWLPSETSKNRDISWAVDARALTLLTLKPLGILIEDAPVDLKPGPRPSLRSTGLATTGMPTKSVVWNNAPASVSEWVGRQDLLTSLTNIWVQKYKRVVGLIGFGGEGKSALARQWIEELGRGAPELQPRSVFWWTFFEKPVVDEFFEAALSYMAPETPLDRFRSGDARARAIGSLLDRDRFVFVLDGLEVLQHQAGSQFGLLSNGDLRQLVSYMASGYHQSLCVVTSRLPLLDLIGYASYAEIPIGRLAPDDGVALLQKMKVRGKPSTLRRIVNDWDGHALTLALVAPYLTEHRGGVASRLAGLPSSILERTVSERLEVMLRRYDAQLAPPERTVLAIVSAFRRSVPREALAAVGVCHERHREPVGASPTRARVGTAR